MILSDRTYAFAKLLCELVEVNLSVRSAWESYRANGALEAPFADPAHPLRRGLRGEVLTQIANPPS
jgi:hypothetical protein